MQDHSLSRPRFPLLAACGLATSVLLLLGCLPRAGADDTATEAAPKGDKAKLTARFYQEVTPFDGEVTRGIVVAETNQFSFVVPDGFRSQADAAKKKLSLNTTDLACSITALIHESATQGSPNLKADGLRSMATTRFPGGRITDEFNASIESMSGPGFEVEWVTSEGTPMTTRLAFVPYPGGHLEIALQAATDQVRKYDHALNRFLLSVRSSPAGEKLKVQTFSSKL